LITFAKKKCNFRFVIIYSKMRSAQHSLKLFDTVFYVKIVIFSATTTNNSHGRSRSSEM